MVFFMCTSSINQNLFVRMAARSINWDTINYCCSSSSAGEDLLLRFNWVSSSVYLSSHFPIRQYIMMDPVMTMTIKTVRMDNYCCWKDRNIIIGLRSVRSLTVMSISSVL